MPTVSIVIRTLNEARHLPELLAGIRSQLVDEMAVEVILVDSGSTDDTVHIAQQHGCRVVTIHREEFSFGRSLNVGCEAASGECLVFVSGHCIPVDDDWLRSLCRPLRDGVAAYVYGRQIGGDETKFSERQIFAKYFPDESQIPQDGFYCNNANAALLRNVWSVHRFDEDLTGLEDMHLAKRLVENGLRIAYAADACVYHLHDEPWPQVQRRFEREALALQSILPQVHLRQRDVVRYLASSITGDLRKALSEGVLLQSAADIVRYRFHQYLGSYCGNRVHQELSHVEKERYFYPDNAKFGRAPQGSLVFADHRPKTAASPDD